MVKNSEKNHKKGTESDRTKNFKDNPLSLDQSLHEVQATDMEKTSF